MVKAAAVDWYGYFKSIKAECPWSYTSYLRGKIAVVSWTGEVLPLGRYDARVYVVELANQQLEALCAALNHGEDEWLFSYPGYGPYAAPVSILIQQNHQKLMDLREKLNANTQS